jgi:mannose-6-phosphate isomerase-like protein (cupin superfamily)
MTMRDLETLPFPAAVGLTHLRVYDTAATDGVIGGSPHLHLASAEAYIPIAGEGEVQTLSGTGEETFPLRPGQIVWFEPGVIHRLVNTDGALELLVIMQNAGLPEAGDAVFTFPDDIVADDLAYLDAAMLRGSSEEERIASALERRDLAVEGFGALLAASRAGDEGPLRSFLERSASLKRGLLAEWQSLVEAGPVEAIRKTQHDLELLQQGSIAELVRARVRSNGPDERRPGIGMCGLLQAYLPEGPRLQGARQGNPVA